jgi:hypothetical protein
LMSKTIERDAIPLTRPSAFHPRPLTWIAQTFLIEIFLSAPRTPIDLMQIGMALGVNRRPRFLSLEGERRRKNRRRGTEEGQPHNQGSGRSMTGATVERVPITLLPLTSALSRRQYPKALTPISRSTNQSPLPEALTASRPHKLLPEMEWD